jgi:hypothetical protein
MIEPPIIKKKEEKNNIVGIKKEVDIDKLEIIKSIDEIKNKQIEKLSLLMNIDLTKNKNVLMSIAKRAKNPNLTDVKIHEIYAIKDKMMQKDVAEKYNMNREIIRRIWNKELLPTDDPEFETFSIKKEINRREDLPHKIATSLGKRSLTTSQYIEIILWKQKKNNNELLNGKKITYMKLAEALSNTMKTKITNDIIKNIWSGRTKLFETDFKDIETMTYQDYQAIIE